MSNEQFWILKDRPVSGVGVNDERGVPKKELAISRPTPARS
jgi:hypothetical protein